MTITLTNNFIIESDEVYSFTSGPAFYVDSLSSLEFINYGTVRATGTGAAWVSSYISSGLLHNAGLVEVQGTGMACGVYSPQWCAAVLNSGTMSVSGDSAYGLLSWSPGQVFDNTGSLLVTGVHQAVGLYFINGGSMSNTGLIHAVGGSSAVGVYMDRFEGHVLENEGVIVAESDGLSVGIQVSGLAMMASPKPNIINRGTITADVAIMAVDGGYSPTQATIENVANYGTLNGHVVLDLGDDVFKNFGGTVNGDIDMGAGADLVDLSGGAVNGYVDLGADDDTAIGSDEADIFFGYLGRDDIRGGGGDDYIDGEQGNDTIDGGAGNDIILGGTGSDTITAGAGDDVIVGGTGNDTIDGGAGVDIVSFLGVGSSYTIAAAGAGVSVVGADGSDTLTGIERLLFDDGYYTMSGVAIVNTINGTTAGDVLTGDEGRDVIGGGSGDDKIDGGAGYDSLNGGDGDDSLTGGFGDDALNGGAGSDRAVFSGARSLYTIATVGGVTTVTGPDGVDTLQAIERLVFADGVFGLDGLPYLNPINGTAAGESLLGTVDGDRITAGDGADVITGRGGNDTIDGGAGTDTAVFAGARSSYTVTVSGAVTTVTGPDGTDTLTNVERLRFDDMTLLSSGGLYMAGTAGADRLEGGALADEIEGGDGADVLIGNGGADLLDGGAGNDVITGGAGADSIQGGTGLDVAVMETGVSYRITATAGGATVVGGGVTDTLAGIETIRIGGLDIDMPGTGGVVTVGTDAGGWEYFSGNVGTDVMYGLGGRDALYGEGGDDLLWGGDGDDSIQAHEGADFLSGGAGSDVLNGGADADVLEGDDGADTLNGDAGDDTLTGGAGDDILAGGAGVDRARFTGVRDAYQITIVNDVVTITGPEGTDRLTSIETLQFADGDVAVSSLPRELHGTPNSDLINGTDQGDVIRGFGGLDQILGGGGDDIIEGGAGDDALDGGAGTDVAFYAGARNNYVVTRAGGLVSISGPDGLDTLTDIEVLRFSDGDVLVDSIPNTINGGAGDDLLAGSAGGDLMSGLAGADRLDGGLGDDVLRGGAGSDALIGGGGVDLADYSQAAGGVTASLTTGVVSNDGDGGSDTLSGIENLLGSAFGDSLTGSGGNNALNGGAGDDSLFGLNGDDVLIGGAGVDVLNGGGGIDTVDYSGAAAGMRAQLNTNASTNDGDGGTDTFTGVENLIGSAFNDILIGDNGVNVLRGGLGSDTLLGLGGNDVLWGGAGAPNTLQGGLGDDLYVLEANDSVTEFAGEGIDTVEARIAVYNLGANVERLVFGGVGDFTGTGNSLDNTLIGGSGDDVLRGRGGTDVLNGGAGTDTADYTQATAGVLVRLDLGYAANDGEGGIDTFVSIENLTGSQYNDVMVGNGANNLIVGGLGLDVLMGGAGDDVLMGGQIAANQLHGGLGNDWFVLDAPDTVIEYAGEGIDTVESRVSTYTLAANVENLIYTGPASFSGWGNGLDNHITGGVANDYLRGMGGNDVIDGGSGMDTLYLRGAKADYTVTAEADGWRIVDSVGGRDGSTFVQSIELLRFVTGNTSTALSYPSPVVAVAEAAVELQVLTVLADAKTGADAFVLPLLPDDQPLVLPEFGDDKGFDAPLVLPGTDGHAPRSIDVAVDLARIGDWMLTLDPDAGLTGPHGPGHPDWM